MPPLSRHPVLIVIVAAIVICIAHIHILYQFDMTSETKEFRLVPFEEAPPPISITGKATRTAVSLMIEYNLQDPLGSIKWPDQVKNPARKDYLWRTTCLEVFIAPQHHQQYWEVNLAPTRDWNVYHFDEYLTGMEPEKRIVSVETVVVGKKLQATIHLTEIQVVGPLQLGISAVMENAKDGNQSFWALTHPGKEKPDFHRRDCFVMSI